jgi:ABC-type cobalamin transport system ATPase subunit
MLLFALLAVSIGAKAQGIEDSSFLPVWQLLNREQKQQFLAGYLQAMKDASKMTDVLGTFVKDNPSSAGESLQRLKGIYLNLAQASPDFLTSEIDAFFADPKNKEAPLSRAVTAARNKL